MSKKIIAEEIKSLIEVINEQQEMVLSHQGKIPRIEMDILLGNIRKLYERLHDLDKAETSDPFPEPVIRESIQSEPLIARTPEKPEALSGDIVQVQQASSPLQPEPATATPNGTAHMQPELIVASVETPVIPERDEEVTEAVLPQAAIARERAREFTKPQAKPSTSTASLFDDAPTIADQFTGSPTLYDKISATREDKSLVEKLKKNPVSDLRKSIGINEKFAFINELFDGDMEGYNRCIEALNNCTSQSEALNRLGTELAVTYNWSQDGSAFLQLKDLVERRFSA